jgi:hypothetical protein
MVWCNCSSSTLKLTSKNTCKDDVPSFTDASQAWLEMRESSLQAACIQPPSECQQRGRRVTCDLTSDLDQDVELVSLATDVLMQARMVPASLNLHHRDTSLSQSSLSEDVHKMVTCTNFKVSTPEKQLRNLMGLLLQVTGACRPAKKHTMFCIYRFK